MSWIGDLIQDIDSSGASLEFRQKIKAFASWVIERDAAKQGDVVATSRVHTLETMFRRWGVDVEAMRAEWDDLDAGATL